MKFKLEDKVKWLCTEGPDDVWFEGIIKKQIKDDIDNTDFAIFRVYVTNKTPVNNGLVRRYKNEHRWVREDDLKKI